MLANSTARAVPDFALFNLGFRPFFQLFAAHALRLAGWHTRGIWRKPLLWVLYIVYGSAASGFLIKALTPFVYPLPFLDLHAFAVGGMR